MLGTPFMLGILICFTVHFQDFTKFFNEWKKFESTETFISQAMRNFARTARLVEYGIMAFMISTWAVLFSVSEDPSTSCTHRLLWDMTCSVSKNVIRVFGAHFMELYFVYLILSVTVCLAALKVGG
jgi:hypothetical protein